MSILNTYFVEEITQIHVSILFTSKKGVCVCVCVGGGAGNREL